MSQTQALTIDRKSFEKKEVPVPQTTPVSIEERIRNRAYELYQSRGGAPGDPESDWYQAEAEVMGTPEQTDH
jgi:hypothetical protein